MGVCPWLRTVNLSNLLCSVSQRNVYENQKGGYEVRGGRTVVPGVPALAGFHQCFVEHGLVTNKLKETLTFVMDT